ncbi:MAG TPA: beta-galactosidase, partial [Candidatus Binatia bacterium]|nr:beta-galactosidase [Candidatus Binatia bacterium]
SFRWFVRWPIYIVFIYLIIAGLSWTVDELLPKAKDPEFGVSFSIEYAQELGNDWHANYLALLNDLGFKRVRLMSYWELIEPQQGQYDFTDLDWQVQQAQAHGAKVSLAIGYRQPRYPECHEPDWAKQLPVNQTAWDNQLYSYISTVVNHYKNNPALESYQLENEAENNWFGACRGSAAPKWRLTDEFNLVKKLDPNHPVFMNLSDEHGLPIGQPTPDAYGFSIYRVVYSTNTEVHFYTTYPITQWYHRLRVYAIHFIKHRPVYVHELQLEPWGSAATEHLTIAQQNQSMSVQQIHNSIHYSEQTGIQLQYMWGGEWWYWRKTHFNDSGPWNAVKQELQAAQNSGS